MSSKISEYCGHLKEIIFPIHRKEMRRFAPMAMLFFFILYNFSSLRILKDSVLVTSLGAEAISFAKLYCVLPFTVLFTLAYIKLSNKFERAKLFYLVSAFFILAFMVFGYIFSKETSGGGNVFFMDQQWIEGLVVQYPRMKWFIRLIGKWPVTLFYIFSELWGSAMVSLMFWQAMNSLNNTSEAKRFYPTIGLIGNIALIVSGRSINSVSQSEHQMLYAMILLVSSGVCVMAVHYWLMKECQNATPDVKATTKKPKIKLSLTESMQLIMKSKHILFILLLVLCYGVTINLVEGPWKDQVKEMYPKRSDYTEFMSKFIENTGLVTMVMMIIGQNILKRFSWCFSAMVTPVVVFVTGFSMFMLMIFKDSMGANPKNLLWWIVMLGVVQNILTKSIKYSLFDATKEMSFINLDDELKSKGKAAIDMIGGRLAKSSGAIIQSGLFVLFPAVGFSGIAPYLAMIFVVLSIAWMFAVFGLNDISLVSKKAKEHAVNK